MYLNLCEYIGQFPQYKLLNAASVSKDMHNFVKNVNASGLNSPQKKIPYLPPPPLSVPFSSTFHLIATWFQLCLLSDAFLMFLKWLGDSASAPLYFNFFHCVCVCL